MRYTFLFLISFVFVACSDNSNLNDNNPYLLDLPISVQLNLNLPEYSQLEFIGNSIYVPNAGNKGIIIANAGSGYLAWDAADPNHIQKDCSILVNSGLNATCGCEDKNAYSLVTGEPIKTEDNQDVSNLEYALRFYRVQLNGKNLIISN